MATSEERASDWKPEQSRSSSLGPLGCYVYLLLTGLVGVILFYVTVLLLSTLAIVLVPPGVDPFQFLLNALSILDIPIAILLSTILAGLLLIGLIRLWLENGTAGLGLTAVLFLIWFLSMRGPLGTPEPTSGVASFLRFYPISASTLSTLFFILLTAGVLGVAAALFWEPALGIIVAFLWALSWTVMTFGLQQQDLGYRLLLLASASTLTLFGGLYLISRRLLPFESEGNEDRLTVLKTLRDCTFGSNYPCYVMVDAVYEDEKLEKRIDGNIMGASLGQPPTGKGIILSRCDHAVAISSGPKFKGVRGPGVILTGRAERPTQTIDLRPQLRNTTVEALTNDGIKVKVPVAVCSKIGSGRQKPELGKPLPYRKRDAFKAVLEGQRMYHKGIGQTPDQKIHRHWSELPTLIVKPILQDIISEMEFDELYDPYRPEGEPPRKRIANELFERLDQELEPLGLQRVGGGISDIQPLDSDIYSKRAENWKAEWSNRIMMKNARGQTERLRTLERARAEAQTDLILNVGQQLEKLSAAKADFRPDVALQLLVRVLEEFMERQPTLGEVVPGETQKLLMDIRGAIEGME